MFKRLLFISLMCLFSSQCFAVGEITTFTLNNGLKVYVKEDHRAPVAVFQIWYRAGSMDEVPGTTGVAHLLEHLMFKGTEAYPEGEFNRIITEHGGVQNAGTSNDFTYYYQLLDKKHLELSFRLESDRMNNIKYDFNDFKKELNVVKEERRMRTDNRPNGVLYERFLSAAFVSSPYHYPVIGWMHEIEQLSMEDANQWYQQWYSPNNANVIVVGDVDPNEVKQLAEKYFADLPRRELPFKKQIKEVQPLGERRVSVSIPAQVPAMLMGFNTPVATLDEKFWQPYALEVLAAILDGGRSSRFQKDLVRDKQIVSSIDVSYDLFGRLPGLFTISVTPSDKVPMAKVEEAIMLHIKRLQSVPVSTEELRRVKKQIIASKTFAQDSISSQASMLGHIVTLGLPYTLYDDYVDKLSSVSAQQIQTVAKEYLTRERLTVATLDPKKGA